MPKPVGQMSQAASSGVGEPGKRVPESELWTPAARAAARLALVSSEEPGSMQHFTTALLVGDLLMRLHTAFFVSLLAQYEEAVARRLSFGLVRTSGGGDWFDALRECHERLSRNELPAGNFRIVVWPVSTPTSEDERRAFALVAQPLAELVSRLQHTQAQPITKKTPRLELFGLLLQVRNKTVHGAYDSRFYADHVRVVDSAVSWLLSSTPLWDADLLYVPASGRGRVLRGQAPTESTNIDGAFQQDDVVFSVEGTSWLANPLVHVRGHNTFLANGSWRVAEASAEFLCHSLAASNLGQGTLRLSLPELRRPPLPTVGQIVDRNYEITRVLGEGQDAVVYLARHKEEGVEYVLKAFREPRDAFDQRKTEFRALQLIDHPGVPRVLEIHSWEDPFHLRFDHIPGAALKTKRGDFAGDVKAVASLGFAVADALDAVHAVGLVHRDVAPDNILIPDDPENAIRLVDFDLVAPIGTVGLAGTSLYRPPESEQELPWTESSDLYSLAVVLYELLTGRLPYDTHQGEIDREPAVPVAEDADRFGEILSVLLKAAKLKPELRYATAAEFLAALRLAVP